MNDTLIVEPLTAQGQEHEPRTQLDESETDANDGNSTPQATLDPWRHLRGVEVFNENGDLCEFRKAPNGKYKFHRIVTTKRQYKLITLKLALKALDDEQDFQEDKETRLNAITALRVLVSRDPYICEPDEEVT